MDKKTNFVEETIEKLFKEIEIHFDDKKKLQDIDDQMKIHIIKFICYKDEKLSIKDLYKYENVLKDSAIKFLEKLANTKLKLSEIISTYEPENYFQMKNNNLFKIYLNHTNKELIPFFMMVGFYSYINLKKNNIKAIKELESNQYFENAKNKYINLKNLFLSHIIKNYSRNQDIVFEGEDEETKGAEILNNVALMYYFESYSCFNDMYGKGCLFYLVDSVFSAITKNINCIYLKKGNDFQNVNALIDTLFDNIYESINLCYYDDNDINILINTLYETIKEYMEYSLDINYIIFVVNYCNKFKEGQHNEKLYMICSFFKGLNELNFKNTFKKINFCHGEDHHNNIEKYYKQIYPKTDKDEASESFEELINNSNDIKKEESLGYNKDIKEKKFQAFTSDINYINEKKECNEIKEVYINKSKEGNINKEKKGNNESQGNNKLKEVDINNNKEGALNEDNKVKIENQEKNAIKQVDNDNNKEGSTNEDNKDNNNKKKQKANANKDNDGESKIKEISFWIEEVKKLKSEMEYFKKSKKESETKIIEEYEKKLIKSEKRIFTKYEKKLMESETKFTNNIKKLNKEVVELKSELKKIKFRDISKVIINNYISKYSDQIAQFKNKKEKAYNISNSLKGKEKFYYDKIIDKYYKSNRASHITGYIEEFQKNNIIGFSKNDDIIKKLINDYIYTIFGIDNNENYKEKKKFISNLFNLPPIVSYLCEKNIYY